MSSPAPPSTMSPAPALIVSVAFAATQRIGTVAAHDESSSPAPPSSMSSPFSPLRRIVAFAAVELVVTQHRYRWCRCQHRQPITSLPL